VIATLGVVLSGCIAWVLADILSRPIEAVARTAREIADGRPEIRVPAPRATAPQELRDLSNSFNSMLDELSRKQMELTNVHRDLRDKVRQLTDLLGENRRLGERVRRAASGTTARNERFLRRISAELHDGPAQALGLGLLRLDSVMAHTETCTCDKRTLPKASADLEIIQGSLREALDEIRVLSSGLTLPELDDLTLPETLSRVARLHEKRTATPVDLDLDGVPEDADLPIKITLFRVVQEALSNAYRHAGGVGQRVRLTSASDRLSAEISDRGPGFEWSPQVSWNGHLGLEGMRERVESLGGTFRIESGPDIGTRVHAELPLHQVDEGHG
jgi:signal transduction histidine kinase